MDPTLSPDNHTVFLFLLSKGTEVLHTYLDSDFAILAYIVECEPSPSHQTQQETTQLSESLDSPLQSMISQSTYDELKAKFDALMRDFDASKANFEAMEKIVNDRDRQARGDRRQIEHFEQECRRQRIENKEIQIKLNEMEIQKMNVEKEKEQLIIDLKSC